jgi:hypothetical protein
MKNGTKPTKFKIIHTNLGKQRLWGRAIFETNTIELDTRLKGKKFIEILTHESLHLLLPTLTEEEIVRISVALTNILWDEGVRRIENDNFTPLQDGTK